MKKVSDAEIERRKAQAARIGQAIDLVGGVTKAAEVTGANRATLFKWRKGEARPPLDEVTLLAARAGVTVDWLATGREIEGDADNMIALPRYDVSFAGELVQVDGADWPMVAFFRPQLEQRGAHIESTIALIVDGREMEPAIREGAIIAVDRARADLMTPGVYVVIRGGRMVLVRCEPRLDGGVILSQDRRPDDRQVVAADKISALNVVGRVVLAVSEP